ncbi:MAG: hypothetical protein RIC19_01750 [Phaeodactylibacter sp.]|uniref:hypothetical protein n=1 Tax=Phaeodactylibacter sp. TaxID=1940289 RepID=UPI0032ECE8A3
MLIISKIPAFLCRVPTCCAGAALICSDGIARAPKPQPARKAEGHQGARQDFAIFRFLSIFAATINVNIKKNIAIMGDEIRNSGKKGYLILGAFIFFLLFVILVVSIYQYNFKYIG